MARYVIFLSLIIFGWGCGDESTKAGVVVVTDASMIDDLDQGSDMADSLDAATQTRDQFDIDAVADAASDTGDGGALDLGPDMMVVTACADAIDNDGDDRIDYPLDPGCTSLADDNELDPDRLACEDGVDNDDDGQIDFPSDPGCSELRDVSEANSCVDLYDYVDVTGQRRVEGTTEGGSARLNVCRNNSAPEQVFMITIRDEVDQLRVDTRDSSFDTLLAVWRLCDDPQSEIDCNDDISFRERTSELLIEDPEPGDYFILIDGHAESAGPFVVNIHPELNAGRPCEADGWISCGAGGECRDGRCQAAACADNQDNDGDGAIDYPNDAGCSSPSDNSETDPVPRPSCADGIDNDFDGRTDYPQDPDCESAADNNESSPPACSDGVDNDQDGFIDLDDPGCFDDPNRQSEFNAAACRNGLDDDQDGRVDFPDDPGCTTTSDPDETDPVELPACSDGLDNDEDGFTDYPEDVISCLFAADDTEDDPCARLMPREITGLSRTRGNTDEELNDFAGSCSNPSSREDVLLWRVLEDRPLENLIINTNNSNFDTVLHVRTSCSPDTEIACDDDSGAGFASQVELGPQVAGTDLLIFVDGQLGSGGIWRMRITAELAAGANCGGRGDYVCAEGLNCEETPEGPRCIRAPCGDGEDNDGDGLIDYPVDPGCESGSDEDETDPIIPPLCSNGVDDDGDGQIDFGNDPNCSSAADQFEGPDCADGIDNDGDGRIDFDQNNDGIAGPNRDAECACPEDPLESEQPDCQDGCDNDRDGLIDLEDPGCRNDPERNTEFNTPQCRDRVDNDGNGTTDYPDDPGCRFSDAPIEAAPDVMPQCSDGVDNDEDGLTDFPADEGCHAAADNTEVRTCDAPIDDYPLTGVAVGTTADGLAETSGTCAFDSGAPERIYRVRAPYPGRVVVDSQGSDYNTVLYIRSECEAETQCPDPAPEPVEEDAGIPEPDAADAAPGDAGADADVSDGAAADAGVSDAAASDAAASDAAADAAAPLQDIGAPEMDAGPPAVPEEPCFPEPTQVACNDNAIGFLSRIDFNWLGGDFYLFVDGFAAGYGAYQTNLEIVYVRGGQCGPVLLDYASCVEGTECLPDPNLGFSTCQ